MTFRSTLARLALVTAFVGSLGAPALAQSDDGAPETVREVIASLETTVETPPDLSAIPGDVTVETVGLSALGDASEAETDALDMALGSADGALSDLHTAVEKMPVLTDALVAEGYAPDQVIGVYQTASGVQILVDDRG